MNSFILYLNPATRDELYSDANVPFIEIVLIEAVMNLLQEMYPGTFSHANQDVSDDPDDAFFWSVEYLLYVIQSQNKKEGVEVSEEDIAYDSDYYDAVTTRLSIAIESVRSANCPTQLAALHQLFASQNNGGDFRFKATHFDNQVFFIIMPQGL